MKIVKVPPFVAYVLKSCGKDYEPHELMGECLSGIKLSINHEYMENKRLLQEWLEDDRNNLLLLTKAILYGYEEKTEKDFDYKEVLQLFKQLTVEYMQQQPFEKAEAIERPIWSKTKLSFHIMQEDGKSMTLFSVYESNEYPVELIAVENDYTCDSLVSLEKKTREILNNRALSLTNYYSDKPL